MIKVTAVITDEENSEFYEQTRQELPPEITLYYMPDDVTGEYYLCFADDMIVIRNTSMTLDNGSVTEEGVKIDAENKVYIQKAINKAMSSSSINSGLNDG